MDLNDIPKHLSDCSVYKDPIVFGTECDCGGYKPKDLTDEEINDVMKPNMSLFDFARAVITADREKNRGAA